MLLFLLLMLCCDCYSLASFVVVVLWIFCYQFPPSFHAWIVAVVVLFLLCFLLLLCCCYPLLVPSFSVAFVMS